jgi:hypothetical protein
LLDGKSLDISSGRTVIRISVASYQCDQSTGDGPAHEGG